MRSADGVDSSGAAITAVALKPSSPNSSSLDRVHDLVAQPLPLAQVLPAVGVVFGHQLRVLVAPPLPLAQRLRMKVVSVVDAGDFRGDEVAEVRIALPLDRPLGDGLH